MSKNRARFKLRRFAPDEAQKIAIMYAQGTAMPKLMARYGCSKSAIRTAITKSGGRIRTMKEANRENVLALVAKQRGVSDETAAELAALYSAGHGGPELASRFGVSTRVVFNAIHRQNTEMRVHTRMHSLNEEAFDDAENNPLASYFLGLMYCVSKGYFILSLTESDGCIVHAFRDFLGSTHAISITHTKNPTKGFENCQPAARIQISSKKLIAKLGQYGVVPRKSACEVVPKKMLGNKDWWRGVIDGDGWVSDRSGDASVRHEIGVTGSMDTCEKFREFGRTISPTNAGIGPNGTKIFTVVLKGDCAERAIYELYRNPILALPRKALIADRIIQRFQVRRLTIPDHGHGEDLTGMPFGKLIVECFAGRLFSGELSWHCSCQCGNSKVIRAGTLKAGTTISCGCFHAAAASERIYERVRQGRIAPEDLTGLPFGRLTVESFAGYFGKDKRAAWNCLCECGNRKVIRAGTLKEGTTISCGCYMREAARERICERLKQGLPAIPGCPGSNKMQCVAN